jgi:hypothetical protein
VPAGGVDLGFRLSGFGDDCLSVPVGTYKQFCWNTVEISENSENHLKAIVGGRQAAEGDGVGRVPKYRHEKRGRREGVENRVSRLAGVGSEC